MAAIQPLTRTLLSLNRYAEITGINPVHFWGAAGGTYFPTINACDDIFRHYNWQNQDNVSRIELANAIRDAEEEITDMLGYSPAPIWVNDEVKLYPQHHRRDVYSYGMANVRGMNKSLPLKRGKFIQGGPRATTLVTAGVAVVYTDEDGDGYDETATISTATALTNKCEIHCYLAGESGSPDWEIRSPRSVTLSGGTITFVYWAWQLLDPELQQIFPTTANLPAIDLEDSDSYLATVDIYREYTDFTQKHCQLLWERAPVVAAGLNILGFCCSNCGGAGCPACEFVAQDGCIHVRDADGQQAVPVPATYDSDAGQWDRTALSVCRDPDLVKLWYYAGDWAPEYLAGRSCEPLSHYWAETIAWLATARVNQPFCTCNNSQTMLSNLQRDLSFTGSRIEGSFAVSPADLDNPFGTKYGEVKAWKRVSVISQQLMQGYAV